MRYSELTLEGRNAVIEAFRAGKTIDKLFVLEHCQEGSMNTIIREAKKKDTIINYVKKERLDQTISNPPLVIYGKYKAYIHACQCINMKKEHEKSSP